MSEPKETFHSPAPSPARNSTSLPRAPILSLDPTLTSLTPILASSQIPLTDLANHYTGIRMTMPPTFMVDHTIKPPSASFVADPGPFNRDKKCWKQWSCTWNIYLCCNLEHIDTPEKKMLTAILQFQGLALISTYAEEALAIIDTHTPTNVNYQSFNTKLKCDFQDITEE